MRKVLPIILLIAMAICLTSCDPEAAAKLGSFMGKMGNNVYGISANMKDVDTATSAVNDAIKPDGSGNYDKNDLMKASALVDSIAKINGSSQKIEALKEDLSKPAAASPENNANLKTALSSAVGEINTSMQELIDAGGLGETQTHLIESVQNTLTKLNEYLADPSVEPSKADVVAVAILNEIADHVCDITENIENYVTGEGTNLTPSGQALVDRGLSCLETLKIVTDIGNLNILGDMSAAAIMDAMDEGSRDANEDKFTALMEGLGNPIGKFAVLLVDGEGENIEFSETKWNSFVFQARSIKTAYELFGCMYMPFQVSIPLIDDILNYDIDLGLTIDDLVLYIISMLSCCADDVAETINWIADFGSFIEDNFDVMTTDDPEGEYSYEVFVAGALAGLQAHFQTLADNGKHWSILSTIAVILNDSGYKTILNMVGGSVGGVYDLLTGDFEE